MGQGSNKNLKTCLNVFEIGIFINYQNLNTRLVKASYVHNRISGPIIKHVTRVITLRYNFFN